jgi:DNA-binding MarR family transcriptional regulator
MDAVLAVLELTTAQYAVLVEITKSPGLSNAELARRSFVTPQTMNLIVQNLAKRKIIERNHSASHSRIINIEITPSGMALLRKAEGVVWEVEAEYFGCMNKTEVQSFIALLTKLKEE